MADRELTGEAKLTELVLYVADRCWRDAHYGVLTLNKTLFYADFAAYRELGAPITGVEYRKYPHGPAPAVMKLLRDQLQRNGQAWEYRSPAPCLYESDEEMVEKRLLARRAADVGVFSSSEISLVDRVIEWLRPMTGAEASRHSHGHPGWRLARMGEKIPYFAALLPDQPALLPAADFARAQAVARRYRENAIRFVA